MSSRSAAAGKIAPRTMARTRPSTIGSHRSEEHTSELQSQSNLVCRLLLEKKKIYNVLSRGDSQDAWSYTIILQVTSSVLPNCALLDCYDHQHSYKYIMELDSHTFIDDVQS